MKISVSQFAELYRQIQQAPRPQGVFVKDGDVVRISAGCQRFERHMDEYYDHYVGTYDRNVLAAWLIDDLRGKGINLSTEKQGRATAKRMLEPA